MPKQNTEANTRRRLAKHLKKHGLDCVAHARFMELTGEDKRLILLVRARGSDRRAKRDKLRASWLYIQKARIEGEKAA